MPKKQFPLTRESIRQNLGEYAFSLDIFTFDTIDSTNTEAKRMVADGYDGIALIAAQTQSGGRGRMGRSFYSPEQTGAYFSILYRPTSSIDSAVTVTSAASVAVLRAIRRLTGQTCGIKWVNDLYLNSKKVCGILTEGVTRGDDVHIVVGIGINIRTVFEGTELSPIAGSLGEETLSPAELIAAVTTELLPILKIPEEREWLADYRRYSLVIGKEILFSQQGAQFFGTVLSIDDEGALLVRTEKNSTVRLFSGEISLKMQ